jgi:hypothetical protein
MNAIRILTLTVSLWMAGFWANAQVINSTVPPLNGGLTDVGITFNLTVNDSITLNRIAISFVNTGLNNYFIWMKNGPIAGPPNITFVTGWTPLQINSINVTNSGIGNLQYIDLTTPMVLAPGTYGMYVGGGPYHISNYTGGQFQYIDADTLTTITTGSNVGYAGPQPTPSTTPRQFNGAIDFVPVNQACPKPTNITATPAGGGTFSVDWTENGSATQWEIEWGISGFTQGTGTFINTTSKPETISGIVSGNSYDIYVRSICGPGDNSFWEGPFTFNTTYCTGGPTSTQDSEITNVFLQGDASAISNLQSCPGAAGVQDFTASFSADVSLGTPYVLNITFGTCGGPFPSAGEAWIDWNQNFIFDAGESIGTWSGNPEPQNSTTFNAVFPFTPPANAVLGTTRMRIMHWEGGALPLDPCGTFTWGSIEDYSIVVTNTPPTCVWPTNPSASNVGSSSADLNWTENNTATQWEIEYGVSGFTLGTGTKVITTSKPLTLSGLSASTNYDFYVRSICGPGDTSGFSLPGSFLTGCGLVLAPWTEDFDGSNWIPDNITGNAANSVIDQCWTNNPTIGSGQYAWKVRSAQTFSNATGPLSDLSGSGNYLYTEASGSFNGAQAILTTPLVDVSGLAQPQVEFWYHMHGNNIGSLVLEVDSTGTWIPVDTIVGEQQPNQTDPWQKRTVILNPTSTIQVRFIGTRGNGFRGDIAIDELTIEEAPTCIEPVSLTASGIFADSLEISWTDINGASQWQLEYGPSGFTPGTGTQVLASVNPFMLTGLNPNTVYDIYIRAICGPSDTSAFSQPLTATTSCGLIPTPWTENFDGASWIPDNFTFDAANSQLNQCWTRLPDNGTDYSWRVRSLTTGTFNTGPDADFSGFGNFLYTESDPVFFANSAVLTSPVLDVSTLASPTVEFWYHMFGAGIDELVVEVNQTGSWIPVDTIVGPQQTSSADPWMRRQVYLGPSSTLQVRFVGRANNFQGDIAIDELSVYDAPSCIESQNLAAQTIYSDSILLSWTDISSATQWEVEYGGPGFTPGTGTSVLVSTNPYMITGLTPNSSYDIYVRAICGPGDTAFFSLPISVITSCAAVTAPWFEDFDGPTWVADNFSFDAANSQLDPCWTRNPDNGTTYSWRVRSIQTGTFNTGPVVDISGSGNFVYAEADASTFSPATILSTPIIDVSGLSAPYLEFGYYMFGFSVNQLSIEVNQGSGWIPVDTIIGQQQTSATDPWLEREITLAPSSTLQVRFIADATGAQGDIAIDEVAVFEAPACNDPSNLVASVASASSVDLTWNAGGSGILWQVEYGISGFTLGSGTQQAFASNSATITGLAGGNIYDFYVREICGGTDTSTWAGPVSANLDYCSGGPTSTLDSEITNVILNGENFSISNLQTCPGAAGIQDFTATDSADVSRSTTYAVDITFGTCGGQFNAAGEAWIDWNQNFVFEVGESIGIWTGNPEPIGSTVLNASFTFTVPSTALFGETTMRIMMDESNFPPLDPCATFTWGSVEDYKLVVIATSADLGPDQIIGSCQSTVLNPGPFTSYLWSTGETTSTITVDGSLTGPGTFNYGVTVTDASGVQSTDNVDIVVVSPPAVSLASTDTVNISGVTSFALDAGSGFSSYLWDDGSNGQLRVVTIDGSYWVRVSDQYGCFASDTVYVQFILGHNEISGAEVRIYPNPADDIINIEVGGTYSPSKLSYRLLSLSGQVVKWNSNLGAGNRNHQIMVGDLPSGMYLLELDLDGQMSRNNLIIR